MRVASRSAAVLLSVALAACAATTVETPDPAAIPTGPIEAYGDQTIGPIVELGSGQADGLGWRYAIYPSDDGWCTQLETSRLTTAGCGDLLPDGDGAFGATGHGATGLDDVAVVDGLVTSETATVWLIADGGRGARLPARLLPLDGAGLDAQAFIGFVPAEMNVTHVMAVALNGRILETYELP